MVLSSSGNMLRYQPVLLFSKGLFEKLSFVSLWVSLLWNFNLRQCDGKRGYECILKCIGLVPISFEDKHSEAMPVLYPMQYLCDSLLISFMSFQFKVSQVTLWLFLVCQASMSAKLKACSLQLLATSQVLAHDPRLHLKCYSRLRQRDTSSIPASSQKKKK